MSRSRPAYTLMTSPQQRYSMLAHPVEDRPLSVPEYARLQDFPDSYRLAGSVRSMYRQIGNAVPVRLAEALARPLAGAILAGGGGALPDSPEGCG